MKTKFNITDVGRKQHVLQKYNDSVRAANTYTLSEVYPNPDNILIRLLPTRKKYDNTLIRFMLKDEIDVIEYTENDIVSYYTPVYEITCDDVFTYELGFKSHKVLSMNDINKMQIKFVHHEEKPRFEPKYKINNSVEFINTILYFTTI